MSVIYRRNEGQKFLVNMSVTLLNIKRQLEHLKKRELDLFSSSNTQLVDIHREMEAAWLALVTGLTETDSTPTFGNLAETIARLEDVWGMKLAIGDGFFTTVDVDVDDGSGGSTLTYQGSTHRISISSTLVGDHPGLDQNSLMVQISNSSDSGHNAIMIIDASKTSGNILGFTETMGGLDKTGEVALVITVIGLVGV